MLQASAVSQAVSQHTQGWWGLHCSLTKLLDLASWCGAGSIACMSLNG